MVYVNLNMNEKITRTAGQTEYEDATGLTIFAESINQIRRLSLLMFAFDKMTTVFVLYLSQSRPNLTLKIRNPPQNLPQTVIQNKNIEFPISSSFHFLLLDDSHFNFYSFSTLHYVLHERIPKLQQPSQDEEDEPNTLSPATDDEDEYFN